MEPEPKKARLDVPAKWVLIEPVLMFNDRKSKPLGFMFDFLDKLLPADEAPAIKNDAIHTYFCNWLMENPPRDRLADAIDYVKHVMGSITKNEDSIRLIGEMEKDIHAIIDEQNKELAEATPDTPPAPPPPPSGDILHKKYAANQDCLTVMLEIINKADNDEIFVGNVQFVMREISIKG